MKKLLLTLTALCTLVVPVHAVENPTKNKTKQEHPFVLHEACKNGNLTIAKKILLSNSLAINEKNPKYQNATPLHIAAQLGNIQLAELLLSHDANVNAFTNEKYTPLYLAALFGHTKLAKLLLDNGAKINARAVDNFTPLHIAVQKNNLTLVRLLLRYKANIDARDCDHFTPLHLAAQYGNTKIAELLLDYGASIDALTKETPTPLDLSAQFGRKEIARLLINNGACADPRVQKIALKYHRNEFAKIIDLCLGEDFQNLEKIIEKTIIAITKNQSLEPNCKTLADIPDLLKKMNISKQDMINILGDKTVNQIRQDYKDFPLQKTPHASHIYLLRRLYKFLRYDKDPTTLDARKQCVRPFVNYLTSL